MSITLRWTFIESKLILKTNHLQSFLLTLLKSGWRCISVLLTSVHCHTESIELLRYANLTFIGQYYWSTFSLIFTSKWVTFNFKLEVVSVFITTIDSNLNFVINEPPPSSEIHVNTAKAFRFKPKCERLLCLFQFISRSDDAVYSPHQCS